MVLFAVFCLATGAIQVGWRSHTAGNRSKLTHRPLAASNRKVFDLRLRFPAPEPCIISRTRPLEHLDYP